jgi:hypothetical protein
MRKQLQNLLCLSAKLPSVFIGLALIAGIRQASAQSARFFRIAGPAATKIGSSEKCES